MTALELLDARDSVLLIIDMQTRLSAAMPADDWTRARDTAITLVRAAEELALPVIVTRQYPRGLGDTVPEIAAALPDHAVTLDKTCFAVTASPDVREALAMTGRRQLAVAGMETHVCILQSAAGLAADGYRPCVVADAVCSRSPAHGERALARLRAGGIDVTVGESCLFEWLGDAAHPRFKALSALL